MKNETYKRIFIICSLLSVAVTGIYTWRQYHVSFPVYQSDSYQYALQQALPYVLAHKDRYESVIITNSDDTYQSYMFYLFYSGFNPSVYQNLGGTRSGGYDIPHTIGKFQFRQIDPERDITLRKTLFVINGKADIGFGRKIRTFKYLNGINGIQLIESDI